MSNVRVFVNEKPVDVSAGATVADAVTAFDLNLGRKVAEGHATVTDGRGITMATDTRVGPGTILRVIVRRP